MIKKENRVVYTLNLNRNTDPELIEYLKDVKNINLYLKRLVWIDMNKESSR